MAHSWTCVKRPLLQSSTSHDSYLPTELVPTFPGQGRLIGLRKGDEVLGELAKLSFFFSALPSTVLVLSGVRSEILP